MNQDKTLNFVALQAVKNGYQFILLQVFIEF